MPQERTKAGIYMRANKSNVGRTVGHNSAASVDAARKTEVMTKAAQMRAAGATFREIGAALDVDPTWAQTLVHRALAEAHNEAVDIMRQTEGARLDRMQRAVWPAAISGDIKAGAQVLRIMERRARLFGLDAPTKVEVAQTPPPPEAIDDELRVIMGMLADADQPAEPAEQQPDA